MKFNWRIVVGNYIGCPKNISDDQIRCTKNFYWFFNFKSFFFVIISLMRVIIGLNNNKKKLKTMMEMSAEYSFQCKQNILSIILSVLKIIRRIKTSMSKFSTTIFRSNF
jgi:hypothetical protein